MHCIVLDQQNDKPVFLLVIEEKPPCMQCMVGALQVPSYSFLNIKAKKQLFLLLTFAFDWFLMIYREILFVNNGLLSNKTFYFRMI